MERRGGERYKRGGETGAGERERENAREQENEMEGAEEQSRSVEHLSCRVSHHTWTDIAARAHVAWMRGPFKKEHITQLAACHGCSVYSRFIPMESSIDFLQRGFQEKRRAFSWANVNRPPFASLC